MQRKSILTRVGATLSAIVSATALTLVATATPAAAGDCTTAFCGGRVYNMATRSVAVTNCWNGILAFIYRETLTCAVNGWTPYRPYAHMPVGPRADSVHPNYYDTDGFRVLRGCYLRASFNGGDEKVFDRRGKSTSQWVKIDGKASATITIIICQ